MHYYDGNLSTRLLITLFKRDIFLSGDVLWQPTKKRQFFSKSTQFSFHFILMLCFSLQVYDVFYRFYRNSISFRIAIIVLYGVFCRQWSFRRCTTYKGVGDIGYGDLYFQYIQSTYIAGVRPLRKLFAWSTRLLTRLNHFIGMK
jgi:hypothetical protein